MGDQPQQDAPDDDRPGASSVLESPPSLSPGSRLGRYVLLEEVGSGGMGVVMSAYDHELGRRVALKLLRPHLSRSGEARLRREAQSLAQLQHPAVVTVFEVGKHQQQHFIAMEYVEGQTFDRWAASRRGRWREVVEVAIRAGRGLAAAHAAGLAHRDVKPGNILVGRDGRVRVVDFGIATATGRTTSSKSSPSDDPGVRSDDPVTVCSSLAVVSSSIRVDEPPLTEAGAVVGTPAYMAPEQHRGEPVDARSDQFAFCVTLYRVLYDRNPFAGEELEVLRRSVFSGTIAPAPSDSPVPMAVRRIVLRGLEADPERRWPSMTALLDQLQRTLGRRRRWVLEGAAVGVIAVGTIVVGMFVAEPEPSAARGCADAQERLAGVWDAERAVKLQDAFAATALPYALDSGARTRERLDRYAKTWSARYQVLCAQMEVEMDAQARPALDLEMACLGRRREALGALVDLLVEDPTTVVKAAQAAAELESVESCARAGQEAAAMPEPAPGKREAVEEIRLALARAEAALKTGVFAVGIDHAQRAGEQARALGYPPVEVEALYRLGTLQVVSGQLDAAEQNLGDAALRAVEVRHDRIAAQAATMQAFVVGYRQGRAEEGLRWLRHATAALSRLGSSLLLEAELRNTKAAILSAQGRYEEALAEFRAGLAQREQQLGRDHPLVASSVHNVGSALLDCGRYDEALEAMERALAIWNESYGSRHPLVATVNNGIGATLERMGRWEEARERFEAALALREVIFGPDHVEVAMTLDNLGSVLNRLGQTKRARAASQRALELRERTLGPRHPHVASSLVNLGLVAEREGQLQVAAQYQRRALEIWEEGLGPEHPYLAFPLTSLGRIEHAQGHGARARDLLERALEIRDRSDEPYERAQTLLALARVLWPDEPGRARSLAERAVVELETTPHADGALRHTIEAWRTRHPLPR
ncbi:MAG: serine/threonine-protein kinase [Myxococcota bacterium]